MVNSDSADQLLRNVMTKRMATYLDGLLKLASGCSLSEDNPELFSRMLKVNGNRNNAIHNGKELTRVDAYEACFVVYEVTKYLNEINLGVASELNRPTFFA
ncbi:hypothetical protein DP49_1120 [Burkholderia pseudomallei]|nr:hypothetical protein DP49_1120 [Burkholderia pseudomallei]